MSVILYSTGCPKCNILKKKLDSKGVAYIENNDVEQMALLGIDQVPVLKIGESLLCFKEANDWINNQLGG